MALTITSTTTTKTIVNLLWLILLCLCCLDFNGSMHMASAKNLHHNNNNDHHLYHHQALVEEHHHHQGQQHQAFNTHHRRRLQRDSNDMKHCNDVKSYFDTIDIKMPSHMIVGNDKGSICGGQCCTNATELELKSKATLQFERVLHHHTKSLRGILEKTAGSFQSHILELAHQSENRTLHVFSQVYKRMLPLSRKLIVELYSEIIRTLKVHETTHSNPHHLEEAIHKFFINLFPVAYHQVVHLNKQSYGELHEDYINCLKHTFDDLQPFGAIPKEITHNLIHSVQTARIFMTSLHQSAEVLREADELYGSHLSESCQKHLLKMSYCPSCNGLERAHAKPCYSYCINVYRGCSAQYAGVLDNPWSNVVDALDHLVTTHIRSDAGIVTVIKQLDSKLSETIMRAMENGPELEKKVKKTCGTPKLLPSLTKDGDVKPAMQHQLKWATPADSEILQFLSTIDKSKEFYLNIVNNVCEDEDIQRNDHHCWTGDRVGDYTQLIMTPTIDTQRYNPEVPLETNSQPMKLNELVDKLLKIRKNIATAVPSATRTINDIQSDMAGNDDEGSGRIADDGDDEEYVQGSGDGSGDGHTSMPYDPLNPVNNRGRAEVENNSIDNDKSAERSGSSSQTSSMTALSLIAALCCTVLVIPTITRRFYLDLFI